MQVRGVFVNASERRSLQTGDILFAAGDAGEEMFGVVSGSIELRRGDKVLTTAGEGETFGEMALIDNTPRMLTAVAAEPTEVAVINRHTFMYMVHEAPMFAIQVMSSLADRIRELDTQI